jgi:hypothetical protein
MSEPLAVRIIVADCTNERFPAAAINSVLNQGRRTLRSWSVLRITRER